MLTTENFRSYQHKLADKYYGSPGCTLPKELMLIDQAVIDYLSGRGSNRTTTHIMWIKGPLNEDILSGFSQATKIVVLSKQTTLEPLKVLHKLERLYCESMLTLGNLLGLEHLTGLKVLDISDNRISSLTELQHLTNLEVLDFSFNQVEDASVISGLKKLRKLSCTHNKITKLDLNCPNLRTLSCYSNRLEELPTFPPGSLLKGIAFSNNRISDLKPLANCQLLKAVNGHHNNIRELTGIEGCELLQQLDLEDNQLISTELVRGLKGLRNFRY